MVSECSTVLLIAVKTAVTWWQARALHDDRGGSPTGSTEEETKGDSHDSAGARQERPGPALPEPTCNASGKPRPLDVLKAGDPATVECRRCHHRYNLTRDVDRLIWTPRSRQGRPSASAAPRSAPYCSDRNVTQPSNKPPKKMESTAPR